MPHPELCFGGGEGSFYVGNAHALYRGQEMRACSLPLSWRMVPGSLFDTRRSLSSGPGPDASKQSAVRTRWLLDGRFPTKTLQRCLLIFKISLFVQGENRLRLVHYGHNSVATSLILCIFYF